jgi:hypothetical protein
LWVKQWGEFDWVWLDLTFGQLWEEGIAKRAIVMGELGWVGRIKMVNGSDCWEELKRGWILQFA